MITTIFEDFIPSDISKIIPFNVGEYFTLLCDDGFFCVVKVIETFDNGYGVIGSVDILELNTKSKKKTWKIYFNGEYSEATDHKLKVLYRGTNLHDAKAALEKHKRSLIQKRFGL